MPVREADDSDLDAQFLFLTRNGRRHPRMMRIDMVDAPDPKYFHVEQFIQGCGYIHKAPTVIVCDQGRSRSPSMALVYLSATDKLPNDRYMSACVEFKKLYPWYQPGQGIMTFLRHQWECIITSTQDSLR